MRSSRDLYVDAVDALIAGRMASVALARDWDLLAEIARLAQSDAPIVLAATDPALFETWRNAVTRFHKAGWSAMTPARVADVASSGGRPRSEVADTDSGAEP